MGTTPISEVIGASVGLPERHVASDRIDCHRKPTLNADVRSSGTCGSCRKYYNRSSCSLTCKVLESLESLEPLVTLESLDSDQTLKPLPALKTDQALESLEPLIAFVALPSLDSLDSCTLESLTTLPALRSNIRLKSLRSLNS